MNGFTTLNRLLGRKNNKNVSKSTSNLSKSNTNLDTSSQYNKIVPLTAMSNAPFEQTFRITVLLPRDQLYVARIGAKTKLDKLLDMLCEDKLLEANKYEFRHPGDWSQVFDNELSIGEVGLNEIRLVSKSDSYNNNDFNRFNHDDIVKLRNNIGRDSLSSSEISRNSRNRHMSQTNSFTNSNHQTKSTTSPYSSSNSLNSMDSTGMNTPTPVAPPSNIRSLHQLNSHNHQPVAPSRKKRMAPRPPSQNSIPEQKVLTTDYSQNNNNTISANNNNNLFKEPFSVLPRKNFHVSSPTLYHSNHRESADIDHDIYNSNLSVNDTHTKGSKPKDYDVSVSEMNKLNASAYSNGNGRPASMYIMENGIATELNGSGNKRNSFNEDSAIDVNHSRTSSDSSEVKDGPLPVPRRRLYSSGPKKTAAPAPPPSRGMLPVPSPRASPLPKLDRFREEMVEEVVKQVDISKETANTESPIPASPTTQQQNVSKVMLNVDTSSNASSTKDVDRVSYSSATSQISEAPPSSPDISGHGSISITINSQSHTPALTSPTPSISKIHVNGNKVSDTTPPPRNKSISSDDEDMKVYNIKSAKSLTTKISVTSEPDGDSPKATAKFTDQQTAGEQRSQSPLWTYTLPAPPKFADPRLNNGQAHNETTSSMEEGRDKFIFNDYMSMSVDKQTIFSETASTIVTDIAIKPIIKERVLLDESLYSLRSESNAKVAPASSGSSDVITSDIEDGYQGDKLNKFSREALIDSLDKRRDRYIEDEFAFLAKADEPVKKKRTSAELVAAVVKRESVEERKISVLDELNNVINKKEMDTLIRKPEERDCFDSANRNSLANFKIMTYSSVATTKVASPPADTTFDEESFIRKRSSQEYARVKRESLSDLRRASDELDFKKPLAPVQRRNLMSNSPIAINRSDSFHSTRPEYLRSHSGGNASGALNHLTPRSTSYISLIGAQKFEKPSFSQNMAMNRRKSTSELSICDSPSLQSLEVMKNILNSSKKNLAVEMEVEVEEQQTEIMQSVTTTAISTMSVEVKRPTSESPPASRPAQSPKPEPAKKWKYQGPPQINFATWNERPKLDVSIKSDTDYKFGGTNYTAAGSATLPKKVLTPKTEMKIVSREASIEKGVDVVDAVTATSPQPPETPTSRSPTKDSEHLPIVRSVEYKKNVIPPPDPEDEVVTLRAKQTPAIHERPSYYESFSKPQISSKPYATLQHTKSSHSSAATQTFSGAPRPTFQFAKKGQVAPTVKGFKDPAAISDNRMSFPATTHFMLRNSDYGTTSLESGPETPPVATPVKAPMLNRSRSEVGMKTTVKLTAFEAEKPAQELPFSQNTLRRTGLKEKILATPQEPTAAVPKPTPLSAVVTPPPPPSTPKTPTGEFLYTKVPPPPQAPPLKAPIVRGVIIKKQLSAPQADPRDMLLDSIRNFSFTKK